MVSASRWHRLPIASAVLVLAAATILLSSLTTSALGQRKVVRDRFLGFDGYVVEAMKSWGVPGLAIAVVKDDSVVLSRGYGVRKLGDPAPVDPHTTFSIGSASKAFTGVLVGRLVDEGKVRWDDPVRTHLPYFEMADPYVTRDITVRDLLTHRSGLSTGDYVWYGNALTREEVVRRIRYHKPSWPFRSTFGYQNAMFIAAGLVVEARRGYSWDEAVAREIFAPLGMTESHTSNRDLPAIANLAQPHALLGDTVQVIPFRNIDNAGPAGSITSNVTDMVKWVKFQLDSGRAGGRRVLSAAALAESHTPQTVIRKEGPWAEVNPYNHYQSYGFGWFLFDYRGRELVHHGGNIDGMSAIVGLVPEERLGVVILTNLNQTVLTDALLWYTVDRFIADSVTDWSGKLRGVASGLRAQAGEVLRRREAARVPDTKPSLSLAQYAGTYRDSLYGDATVTIEDGHLVARYGAAFVGDLVHWHYDTFRAAWRDRMLPNAMLTFQVGPTGRVAALNFGPFGDFARVADRAPPPR